jgi:hypothetical protein
MAAQPDLKPVPDVQGWLAGFRGGRVEMLRFSSSEAHQPVAKLVPDTRQPSLTLASGRELRLASHAKIVPP